MRHLTWLPLTLCKSDYKNYWYLKIKFNIILVRNYQLHINTQNTSQNYKITLYCKQLKRNNTYVKYRKQTVLQLCIYLFTFIHTAARGKKNQSKCSILRYHKYIILIVSPSIKDPILLNIYLTFCALWEWNGPFSGIFGHFRAFIAFLGS